MSLKPMAIPPVPEETARIVRAVFPRGNTLMQLRDILGTIYTDEGFADLFPTHGQPAVLWSRIVLQKVSPRNCSPPTFVHFCQWHP